MAEAVTAATAAYRASGYGTGHRVGLILENRPAVFVHWFALNALGASVVPLNPDLRQPELAYLIRHSGICLAVAAARHVRKLHEAASGCAVVTEDAAIPPAPSQARDETPGPSTECALLYTSGTTGKPKGCVLSNDYFLRCGRWYTEIGGLCALRPGEDRLITPLPMIHMNAMAYSTLAMVLTGGCIVPLDRFHPRSLVADRPRQRGDHHALSRRDAGDAAGARCPRLTIARTECGSASAPGVDPRYHAAFERASASR